MKSIAICLMALPLAALAQQDSVFSVETRLVEVYASVFDRRGNPLPGLPRERFRVFDGGQPQTLLAFEGAEERLSCALVLDVTGSMGDFLPMLKNSAVRFVDELREGEQVAVYTFSKSLQRAQDFTAEKKLVKQAILRTTAHGATALFDAVSSVSRDLEARKGKKAIVLFTDGKDNASTLTGAGAARRAHSAGIPIYAIAQGEALKDKRLLTTLEKLASDTGGLSFEIKKPKQIAGVFSEISRNLAHTYLLTWKPPAGAGSGWRPIRVTVSGVENARVRARNGYLPE